MNYHLKNNALIKSKEKSNISNKKILANISIMYFNSLQKDAKKGKNHSKGKERSPQLNKNKETTEKKEKS